MGKNKNLNAAAKAKKDEFYTQIEDINREVCNYAKHFEGKKILCNCDDPFESQFFFHFAVKFYEYKLQKLIATSYKTSPVMGDLFNPVEDSKVAYKVEINEIKILPNTDRTGVAIEDVKAMLEELKAALGNKDSVTVGKNTLSILHSQGEFLAGDFRSKECIAALEDSDIVVTNPPFSLFREFVALLMQKQKQFLIIGNQNAITYKEIFPLIMQNKIWLGYGFKNAVGFFRSPYEDTAVASHHKEGLIRNSGVTWFTNLEHDKRHHKIYFSERYERTPEKFPHYDNYDAIEVSKTLEIPEDYFGVMGVPITFLDKYCPEQFEILGATESEGKGFSNGLWKENSAVAQATINGKKVYKRLFIRRKIPPI